jgi:hypothetical protein
MPSTTPRIRVSTRSALAILIPYAWEKFREQLVNCLPIVAYLIFLQLVVLRTPIEDLPGISLGIFCVVFGLMFFMQGLVLGLMPFGETIGSTLPAKSGLRTLIAVAFLIGVGATLAEPAIGVLKEAGRGLDPRSAPLLYELLNHRTLALVLAVGFGVGLATVMGMVRFAKRMSLVPFWLPSLLVCLALTAVCLLDPATSAIIGLAWDCGGVTTGPVTVPLVLALGVGITLATGESDTGMSGFGIVTLASLLPIAAVLGLGLWVYYGPGPTAAPAASALSPEATHWSWQYLLAIRYAVQAILPLCAFLYLVQRVLLREELQRTDEILVGIGFCLVGLAIFNIGLTAGLTPLASQVGGNLPRAFTPPEALYGQQWGKAIAVAFAFLLGYGATLAEPALNALGRTVENITQGAFKKRLLMHAVASGVGTGIALGIATIVWQFHVAWLLLPLYLLSILLTLRSSEAFVNIGWDSAGVTTGPITVPLVISMGLGVGGSVGALQSFGMIAMASVCPILVVLTLGLFLRPEER